jgi:hypothetical protein
MSVTPIEVKVLTKPDCHKRTLRSHTRSVIVI